MRIGIDVSQLAYPGTGVARYLESLVLSLLSTDQDNEYVLFFSSTRRKFPISNFQFPINKKNVTIKIFKFPPSLLDLFWNRLHVAPIEWFIGDVDIFITSDWAEPPVRRAKKSTILYDLIVYKYPEETHALTEVRLADLNITPNIVSVQKRKLDWVKKESKIVFCISESTRQDAHKILSIPLDTLRVIYPGVNLI